MVTFTIQVGRKYVHIKANDGHPGFEYERKSKESERTSREVSESDAAAAMLEYARSGS